METVDANVGFSTDSFNFLRQKVDEYVNSNNTFCMSDERRNGHKKLLRWKHDKERFTGCVDLGIDDVNEDDPELATEVLVFMITCIDLLLEITCCTLFY